MARSLRPLVALVLAVGVAACAGADDVPREYASVTTLFEELGGEEWCGTELRVTFEDAIASCGPGESRVLLSASYPDLETLVGGVRDAVGDELLLLLPADTAAADAWFDVRSLDRTRLEQARGVLGGVIIEGDDAIESWLATNGS